MRQREITWQGWRVSWPDVDGGRHEFAADDHEDAVREARSLRKAGRDDVRVSRVTRHRLAPLVEIAAWRKPGMRCGDNDSPANAYVFRGLGREWVAQVLMKSMEIKSWHPTKRAAKAAAEAHLAVLGYRVARWPPQKSCAR